MRRFVMWLVPAIVLGAMIVPRLTAQRGGRGPLTATSPYPPDPSSAPYATHPNIPHYNVTVRHNVAVPMRDGVSLRADVYWPDADGTFPVLMTRTPYNKDGGENMDVALRGTQRGFIMVNMDVRGRFASPGEWYPFKYEINDGYDSVEWAAKLPKSDGKVGMWGGSYDGATQFLAALANPPHLAGIFPMCTASNYYKDWAYQNGALQQYFAESWATQLAADQIDHQIASATNPMQFINTLPLGDYTSLAVPAHEGHAGLAAIDAWYLDWISHSSYDAYWRQWAIDADYSRITVPVYQMGGWYDLFLYGTLANYSGIREHGGSGAARNAQRLLIVPGGHAGWGGNVGSVNFAPSGYVDYYGVMMDWYDSILRGESNGIAEEKPVRYFVMGKNVWADADSWPPAGAQETRYYLGSSGKTNSSKGDGALSTSAESSPESAADQFVENPMNPVPTLGGQLCCDARHLSVGVQDQASDEARSDVLVYSTPPLAHDLNVTGPVHAELYVSSSAPDTDFVAMLTDVAPDGVSHNIADGIVRMRYRNSLDKAEFVEAGEIYKIDVDLWATSNVFLAGHRLQLDIAGSNFPRFDRNLNTKESPETGAQTEKATNRVYHDASHPSALILPVMSGGGPQ
ncbi:MAG: CocE/NonD family hydrolase [Candidatus Acidiferrales bacterium]